MEASKEFYTTLNKPFEFLFRKYKFMEFFVKIHRKVYTVYVVRCILQTLWQKENNNITI